MATLDAKLGAVTAELAARSQDIERPVNARGDVVAHHLAAGLRVRFSQGTLKRLSAGSPEGAPDAADLEGLRDAWLGLATNEYVAVAALDAQLETPSYNGSLASLPAAIVESAANVICGARLIGRPGAFRHPRAWRHQAVALTYALEAYVAGLRGHAPSLTQAQLIALTRLVRATVAIVLIDLHGDTSPTNGVSGVDRHRAQIEEETWMADLTLNATANGKTPDLATRSSGRTVAFPRGQLTATAA